MATKTENAEDLAAMTADIRMAEDIILDALERLKIIGGSNAPQICSELALARRRIDNKMLEIW